MKKIIVFLMILIPVMGSCLEISEEDLNELETILIEQGNIIEQQAEQLKKLEQSEKSLRTALNATETLISVRARSLKEYEEAVNEEITRLQEERNRFKKLATRRLVVLIVAAFLGGFSAYFVGGT